MLGFLFCAAALVACGTLEPAEEETPAVAATPKPVHPKTADYPRPRRYPQPAPTATPAPVQPRTEDEEASSSETVFLDPEADRSFSERKSPEELGEERGEINVLDENDPLLAEYERHGVKWPMVANAGSSKVYEPQKGRASYYWQAQKTASGSKFDPSGLTAAHKSLPFGTLVRCTRRDNGKSVTVMINDRGPYVKGRIIDLSKEAARKIAMHKDGVVRVTLEVIAYPLVETNGPKGNG